MRKNTTKKASPKGKKSQTTTLDYLLKKKNMIYKWIVQGLTIADVAEKLYVSRSWLFEMFKANQELNDIKNQAFEDRRDRLENTIYQMALGNYKTRVRKSKTTKATTSKLDSNGKVVSTETSDVVTEHSDETVEHINDPNLRAIAIIKRQEGITKAEDTAATIDDTIGTDPEMTFVDVANINEATD